MFGRARLRLALLSLGLAALVVGLFSAIVYVGFATILAPTFDLGPELTNAQAAEAAYRATLDRLALALGVADVATIAIVGAAAWVLAARALRPIREAHLRQRRFVADASHEMRTPLAAIRVTAESAIASDASEAELRDALVAVAGAAERLAAITSDLLALARSDELPVARPEPIDLSVTVGEAVEAYGAAHPALPPARLDLAPDVRVAAVPDEVARIVANLLDNAYRHGGGAAGTPPRITTSSSDREAFVDVRDAGPGIAAADQARVFEPFYRVRQDATGPAGAGLGLAIAASLARRNGGRLSVTSEPGAGATFRLGLPRRA